MKSRLVNSSVAFALAVLVTVTLHELAHYVAGLVQGRDPVLYGFSVDQGPGTNSQRIGTAVTGPIFSLVSGALLLLIHGRQLSPFWRLTLLWAGVTSVGSAAGYLITGAFVETGDVGLAWSLADVGAVVPWVGFIIGWVLMFVLGMLTASRFGELMSSAAAVKTDLPALTVYGWLIGTVIAVILSVGLLGAGGVGFDVAFFCALGLMASGVSAAFVTMFAKRAAAAANGVVFGAPLVGVLVLIIVAALRQFILGPGIG